MISIDGDFERLRNDTVFLMRFVAAFGLLDAIGIIIAGALKGAGDVRFVLVSSVTIAAACVAATWLGLRAGHGLGASAAPRARLALDHDRLFQARDHLIDDEAGGDIGGPAGSERHHQPDRLRWIGLRVRERRVPRSKQQNECAH